jgi:acyl carrier protein
MGLDSVELLIRIEKHFEIEVTDQEAEKIITVGNCLDLVCQKLLTNGQKANPAIIQHELIDIISDQIGIRAEEIELESKFIDDLGID